MRHTVLALGLLPCLVAAAPGEAQPRAASGVFYVNFDGGVITGGPDDASTNTSELAEQFAFTGAYPPYGGSPAQRASVLAAVRADWAPFDVDIVDTRPAAAPYAMMMIGPLDHPLGAGINAVGQIDCWDENPNNVGFVFFGAEDLGGAGSTSVQATEASQAFAHALGLEHVTGSGSEADIMYPTPTSPTSAFVDVCFALAPGATCDDMHAELSGCAEPDRQNSHGELLGLFGPAQSDGEAPSVEIASPADGDRFELGQAIEVVIDAADDLGVVEVELALDGESQGVLVEPPYAWTLDAPEPGGHVLVAAARDAAGNESLSLPHGFVVSEDATEGGGDGDACGCNGHPGQTTSWGGLALLISLVRRRRTPLRRID